MPEQTEWTEFEWSVAAALGKEPAEWTEACLDPDILIELIEGGGSVPEAAQMLAHLASCAYCRQEYAEMRHTLQIAARLKQLQSQASPSA